MISKVIGRLCTLQRATTAFGFSSYDDFKNKGKNEKKGFFGKKDKPKEDAPTAVDEKPEEPKQNPSKMVKFLKKSEFKKTESEGKRQSQPWRKEVQSLENEAEKPAPFLNPRIEEDEDELENKSIFFSKSAPKAQPTDPTPASEPEPQLNQFLNFNTTDSKFYDRLAEDSDKLLTEFSKKNWQGVNQMVSGYSKFASQQEIEKEVHSIFIGKNVVLYLDWLKSLNQSYKNLSDVLLRKTFNQLVKEGKNAELNSFLSSCKNKPLNLGYQVLDTLFSDVNINDQLSVLQSSVKSKMSIAIQILKIQAKSQEKQRANKDISIKQHMGNWINKITQVSLARFVCRDEYIEIFQEVVLRHSSYVNLQNFYDSELFIQVIETFYFSSHINSAKLHYLFENALSCKKWSDILSRFRKSVIAYKIRTGKFPFPNVKNYQKEYERYASRSKPEIAIFYYILALYGENSPTLYKSLSDNNPNLFKLINSNSGLSGIVDDSILSVPNSKTSIPHKKKETPKQNVKAAEETTSEASEQTTNKAETVINEDKKYMDVIYEEISAETNKDRRNILKLIVDESKPAQAVKAAIQLGKQELAYYLCYKHFIQPSVDRRMRKDIIYSIKAYMKEHQKTTYEPYFVDIMNNIAPAINKLNPNFILSIYDRIENFDERMWDAMPEGLEKHLFWESSLILDRAQDYLRLEVSDKFRDMKYEPEYDTLPLPEKDAFMQTNQHTWRNKIINELGIRVGFKKSEITREHNKNMWEKSGKDNSNEFDQPADEEEGEALEAASQEAAEGQAEGEVAAEGEAAVEGEAVAEGAVAAGQEVAVEEEAAVEAAAEGEEEKLASSEEQGLEEVSEEEDSAWEPKKAIPSMTEQQIRQAEKERDQNIFDEAKKLRIKGYDFTAFMNIARSKIRPHFEAEYEVEKEYIKHYLALESIAEEARILDNNYLQKRLSEHEEVVKNEDNIETFAKFGLWKFNFLAVEEAADYIPLADTFRTNFFKLKRYNGTKGQFGTTDYKKHEISDVFDLTIMYEISHAMIEDLLKMRFDLFMEAEAVNKLKPIPQVQDFISWGLLNDQPMAIYLGEKMAMITSQIIPHKLALGVSNYLSHRRQLPAERIQRCKECLKIVGRINREHIYDFNKDYHHITIRKQFHNHLAQRQKQLTSSSLAFLQRVDPLHDHQEETAHLRNGLRRGSLLT